MLNFSFVEITCTLPLLSENTISTPSKQHYKARDTVIFSCREGYKLLTDHDFVFCQKDGTWDQSVPTCDPQTCKHTPSVPNAVAQDTKAEYSVGHTMTFTCNFGFRLSEVNPTGQINCLPNGHWESNIPVCEIVTCPNPPTVLHSDSDIGRLTYLGRVTYNCDPGYELFGPTNVIECLEEGSWDPSPPECLPVECGDPGLIANGHVTSLSYTFKSVASYKCNYGYILRGNGSRVCQSNKEWSGTAPVCSPVSCGQPETIENGVFEENGDTYGSIATYGCYPGYDLQGEAERTCEASAMWSGSAPGCTKKECGSPPPVIHGHQTSSGVYFQDTVNYTCETGFRLNGFSYLRCLANGEWGPLPPVCEAITCPTPEIIQNGNYTTTGDVFGSRVEYFCLQGYKLTAESIRVCQPDGSWSSKVPSCAADECPIPLPVENGRFDFKDRSLGSVVLYFCNTGYKLNGTDFRRCESTLSWSGDEPVCTPKSCVEPDDILNGERNVSGMLYNSIVTYECDIGYNMTGSSQRTCLSSGSWSGTAPSCNPIVCDTPTKVISNGRSFGNSSTYQSVVTYICDPGYNLNGASRRQCLISGQWDFEIPICEVVHCARPHLKNGIFSNFKTEYSSIVTFQCRSGYVLFGASERTCLESGFWSGRSPVCVKVKEKPNVEYASVLSNGYNITYSCLYGYRLVGDPTLQFQEDGQWHGNTPNCVPIECNTTSLNIDNFMNGEIVVGNITVGSSAVFTCNTGFTLTGPSSRVCLSDGSWSGSNPICNIVYCSGKFQIDNGIISGPSNHFNSSLQFTCVPGYRLIGDDIITCLENGSWSGSSPVCERISCSLPNDTIVLSASYSTLTVGGNVHYTCPQNYRMIGDSLRTCLTSGEWSGIEPTCRVKQCPIPIISNGRIEMTSRNIGSFITYTCNEGYILVGSVGRFCTTAETWTQEDPTCEVIRCPSPPTIYGGIVLDNGRADFVYGDMVRYKCNEGFVIQEGDTEHICQGSGTWLGQLPVCASVACGPPPVIQNSASKLLNTTYTFNSVVEYTCNEGYRSQSSHSLTSKCQASGSWSLVSFTCLKVQCPSFPTIANGNVLGDSITFGSNISVLCDVGFIITGESHITCLSNGSWSIAQFPSCKRIACPIPDIISNGNVRYNELYVGDSVQYSCSTGFELVGNSKRICTGSGQWSGNKPYCQRVVCSDPPIHPNAVVSINTTEYYSSDEITYSCLPGYTMTVQGRLLCNSKGLWEGTAPTCTKIKCEQPSYIANGDPHFTDITFGSAVTYTCRSGYVLSGSTSMTCLETGSWSGARPTCNPVDCGPATPIEDGVIVGDVYTYGNSVTYICDEGFELTGASDLICRADRTWSNPPPLCQRINCGPPPTVSDADILGNNFFFQGVVTYTCHSGYKMRGDATIVCGSNAKWSSNVTRCELITCGEPPEIPNARVSVSGQRSNSLSTYMCSNGYTMVGDPIAVCTNTGVWSVSKRFSCDPVDCGSPPSITNATLSYKSTTFSSYAVYRCQQGYSLQGNDRIQCGGSGLWDSSLPVCVMELCPAPNLPPNVIIDSGTYRSGDSLVFRCSDGYDLLGSKTIACTASGTWSSSVPNCQSRWCC